MSGSAHPYAYLLGKRVRCDDGIMLVDELGARDKGADDPRTGIPTAYGVVTPNDGGEPYDSWIYCDEAIVVR